MSIQKDVLLTKLSSKTKVTNSKAEEVRIKIAELNEKNYISKYTQALAENAAEVKTLSAQYKALTQRVQNIKPGTQCPTCLMRVTEENLSSVRNGMLAELKSIAVRGKELIAQGNELKELDNKSRAAFEQFRTEDVQKLAKELEQLESSSQNESNCDDYRKALEQIDELQKYGNLSEEEYCELNCLDAELTGVEAQIKAIKELTDNKKLEDAYAQKDVYEKQILKYKDILSALSEFVYKRTELAVANLQMPNVKIKLFDVYRSTGEVTNVFKFTYKGRDYTTLSLSEKTLAGIEITAMIRKITGIDCPICVDNTESVAAFNSVSMPSQTLLLRFVKGQPLTVQSKNNLRVIRPTEQELKKAS